MVGTWGPLTFDASHVLVQEIGRTSGKNTASFQLIEGKPRSQYIGPTLRQISLSAFLCAAAGVRPRDALEQLQVVEEKVDRATADIAGLRAEAQRMAAMWTCNPKLDSS